MIQCLSEILIQLNVSCKSHIFYGHTFTVYLRLQFIQALSISKSKDCMEHADTKIQIQLGAQSKYIPNIARGILTLKQ